MDARPGLLWLLGLALCALGGGHLPRPPHVFPQRRLGVHERRHMQREILAVLGLPRRPRSRAPPAAARQPASAPLFMLDLYHAMEAGSGRSPQPHLDRADLVVSFVNMVERDRTLGYQEPHWKEFHFDLSQIPAGETVTAAEFRIYKEPSPHPLNTTLHVSMFEVVQEHSNRESDLFFLDLQTLRSGDEGWLVLDITAASDRWLLNHNKDLGLRLYVETEEGHSLDPGLAGLLGQQAPRSRQPFMVGFFRASLSPVRAPRTVRPLKRKRQLNKINQLSHPNKLPGIFDDGHGSHGREVCSRHELYVSFRELGWLNSVIAPQGYSAYYCEGECIYPLNSCMNSTNHATMQALVHLMKPEVVPKVCCVPTELSAISLLYYDRNNNVILRRERNMVVQACGCH
ncbi:bone morphogenetic protein 8B [Meriones unguiculatus]|uniref:bone morphogenetic protein 8B n=1 Tax=Meriones unguiculatus TaxID=10047 RepID=UPI00293F016F|nr:bone morphogenetic protein 8B [Meriones unguiculatus]